MARPRDQVDALLGVAAVTGVTNMTSSDNGIVNRIGRRSARHIRDVGAFELRRHGLAQAVAGVIGSCNEPDAFSTTQYQRGTTSAGDTLATSRRRVDGEERCV